MDAGNLPTALGNDLEVGNSNRAVCRALVERRFPQAQGSVRIHESRTLFGQSGAPGCAVVDVPPHFFSEWHPILLVASYPCVPGNFNEASLLTSESISHLHLLPPCTNWLQGGTMPGAGSVPSHCLPRWPQWPQSQDGLVKLTATKGVNSRTPESSLSR